MESLLAWGLVDVFRQHHPEGGQYSWWDYRMLAFPKNDGLRLDYVLATARLGRPLHSRRNRPSGEEGREALGPRAGPSNVHEAGLRWPVTLWLSIL